VRDIELKLISELMKNSRGSDRELVKTIRVSQPTVTRIGSKLEKEGHILEYIMMSDFVKPGYHLFALTFVSMKQSLSPEDAEKARALALEGAKNVLANIVVIEKGMGLGHTAVIGSFHKDYASYV
jgi:DNA-binding Lrp family transcriptional regulator